MQVKYPTSDTLVARVEAPCENRLLVHLYRHEGLVTVYEDCIEINVDDTRLTKLAHYEAKADIRRADGPARAALRDVVDRLTAVLAASEIERG